MNNDEGKNTVDVMGEDKLKIFVHELLSSEKSNAEIDWHHGKLTRTRNRVIAN